MHDHGIQRKYSDITDTDLDSFVKEFKRRRPESGIRYIVGFLRKNGIRVQYLRVVRRFKESIDWARCCGIAESKPSTSIM